MKRRAKRILIVGARGYIGRRVAAILNRIDTVEVTTATRSGAGTDIALDLTDRSAQAALDDYDLVVNCSDADPTMAASRCLQSGTTFVETSADLETTESLHKSLLKKTKSKGAVIIGAGLFPGVSDLLAASLPKTTNKKLAIVVSPLGGAGLSMCRLMVKLLTQPARSFHKGKAKKHEPGAAGEDFSFYDESTRQTIVAGMPEAYAMSYGKQPGSGAVYLATQPSWLLPLIRISSRLRPGRGKLAQWYDRLILLSLQIVRGFLFSWRDVPIQITASSEKHARYLLAERGLRSTAVAIAAFALLALSSRKRGVYLPAQIFNLEKMLTEMKRVDPPISLHLRK